MTYPGIRFGQVLRSRATVWVIIAAVALVTAVLSSRWFPAVSQLLSLWIRPATGIVPHEDHDADFGLDDKPHAEHTDGYSLALTPQARKNIGLTTVQVQLQPFERTISVPALVVERPGRTQVEVTAPLGGRVTRVYPIQGEAVMPGQPLFDLRLTHEELVKVQSDLLRAAEELDVVEREIHRLQSVTIPGAIPGKTIREREYEQQKLLAQLDSQRQSLILHGLTPEQVDEILRQRQLLQGLTVVTPPFPPNGDHVSSDHPFHVHQLTVNPGQYVNTGDSLCVLADHHELYIEGRAFEQDAELLNRAANEGWNVWAALLSAEGAEQDRIAELKLFYLSDIVETESRAFCFYVRLPNQMIRDVKDASGHRFVGWKFKPGQRMQVHVPVQRFEQCIVLPVDAVAQEGAEAYVFVLNGNHFDRMPVHIEHRDRNSAVIEDDGRLVGSTVAASAAFQLQLALRNKPGSEADAHAGHVH